MEKPKFAWKNYHENTLNAAPRKLLVEALGYVRSHDKALDLGCGALNDTRYLISVGFKHITAVDTEPSVKERATDIDSSCLDLEICPIESYDFVPETYDLINAQYTLPFIESENFDQIFDKIKKSLKQDGVLSFQLFGENDDWSANQNMTFHTYVQILKLLSDMSIIKFEEEERDGSTASGGHKHWHVFHLIVKRI